ncbi:methylated-DNA--[protein]-cysteine S-methyltransferase [Candidatus Odyssella acanthamoebae]|uniref:methylated-DNA--[protein]-cysteine S-methyltransferase n=1 Tax=Candidatus Odyssella acanthamoebae TaxID=91604 RepID=UPI0006900B6B|nr:MGMT family protein [Candidatus Paracaedibacter acanthamoebae]
MKLTVIDRKKFEQRFPDRQHAIFNFAPYGSVEVDYTGNILHGLRPSAISTETDLPDFHELVVCGTAFQEKVWRALLTIPFGETVCYSDIAHKIGHPRAVRAVGSALGANPIGVIIPCHRVLAKYGKIGGFDWGIELKQKWLAIEADSGSTKEHP